MLPKIHNHSSEIERELDEMAREDRAYEKHFRAYFAAKEGKESMKDIRNRMAWIISLSQAELVSDHPEFGRFHLGLFPRAWQIVLRAGLEPEDRV